MSFNIPWHKIGYTIRIPHLKKTRMKNKIFTLPLMLVAFFFISGCTKNEVVSNQDDLIGTWQVTGISSSQAHDWDGDGYTETDIYNSYSYCQRDIALVFDYNGTGQSRQGCTAPWQSLYWQFSNGNRTLNISLPGDELNLDITQFNGSTLRGQDQVYVDGQNFTITYTLSKR